MLGVDVEGFFVDGSGLAIPALTAFSKQSSVKMTKIFKEIPTDIKPSGYESLVGKFGTSALTEDGLAFEITTKPSDDPEVLVDRMTRAIGKAITMGIELGLDAVTKPYVEFDPSWVDTQAELRVLGCNPDFSAHGDPNAAQRPAQTPKETFWRTGGGHVHFSVPGILERPQMINDLILLCDATLGLADVLIEHSTLGIKRREMYGQAGRFRIQPWGVEYRTPSNTWMTNPGLAKVFLNLASLVHRVVENDFKYYSLETDPSSIARVIARASVNESLIRLHHTLTRLHRIGHRTSSGVFDILNIAEDVCQDYNLRGWLC